ncbi:unnamed protein product [Parajaminaea phylloscopi]
MTVVQLYERASTPLPDPPSLEEFANSSNFRDRVPIVIDNGTSELRAGFAPEVLSAPDASPLHFPPLVSRYKDRKRATNVLLVGHGTAMDTESKSKARGPTEGGLLAAQDVLENVLDFTFMRLGAAAEDAGAVEHPIVMSEPLCNPGYCRGLVSELLFEAYGVPAVAYGMDSLFSAYYNGVTDNALVVSSGQSSTTIVPMVQGKGILTSAKRLNWSGSAASEYLLRLMQLKYPAFPVRLTLSQSTSLIETQGLFYMPPMDYPAHVRDLSDLKRLQSEGRAVQVPFTVPESSKRKEPTEEELQRREDRKKEATRRLQEMTQKTRIRKLAEKEEQIRTLTELREWKDKERKADWVKRIEKAGFDSEEELVKAFKRVQSAIKRSKRRDTDMDDEAVPEEAPTFPLIEIPDAELDEASIKEKRRQRLLKAGYDARQRAKAEKMEEQRQEEERKRKDEEERLSNLPQWCSNRKREYEETIERIKDRKRKRELLADRKSLAAQQRMKSIASLASDGKGPGSGAAAGPDGGASSSRGSKRRRGGAGGDKDDDNFGADDEDWAIYRDIQGAEDSEDEQDDEDLLVDLEMKLLKYDDSFTSSDTLAARQARKRALTRTFLGGTPEGTEEMAANGKKGATAKSSARGAADDEDEDDEDDDDDDDDMDGSKHDAKLQELARAHQITLNVERARLAEVFYEPSMAGVDQAGLDEIADMVVRGFPDESVRRSMTNNIFVTGRHTSYEGFDDRLRDSMRSLLPVSWSDSVRVIRAKDVRFDAWRGMAKWALAEGGQERSRAQVTRQEYDEMGAEYIKEHNLVGALI